MSLKLLVFSSSLCVCSAFLQPSNLQDLPAVQLHPQSFDSGQLNGPQSVVDDGARTSTPLAIIGLVTMGVACRATTVMAKKYALASRIASHTHPTTLCGQERIPSRTNRINRRVAKDSVGVFEPKQTLEEFPETRMSPTIPFLKYPKRLEGWVGGEEGFDPLGISDHFDVYWLRKAELKHGRICILAVLFWVATDSFQSSDSFQEFARLNVHNENLVCVAQLLGIVLTIEMITREAGDYYLGKVLVTNVSEEQRELRLKELKLGRLAMLAFSGLVTAGHLTQQPFPFS